MSDHDHTEFVKGCFRCELGRDEAAAIEAETNEVLAGVMRRILSQTDITLIRPLRRQVKGTDDPCVLDFEHATVLEVTDEEFEILSEVQDFDELADIAGD